MFFFGCVESAYRVWICAEVHWKPHNFNWRKLHTFTHFSNEPQLKPLKRSWEDAGMLGGVYVLLYLRLKTA
jgi:hypothetical protein